MPLTVAVIAAGAMGAAVGARLSQNGVTVLTSLAGRSDASAKRAAAAGMTDASDAEISAADFILSIVPPADAETLAQRLAPTLRANAHKPVYVDCNAINPDTVSRVATAIAGAGCPFVDGGIIGGPPRPGSEGPGFYVSGEAAAKIAVLGQHGLKIHVMTGKIGDASALKMSYAALTKGLVALGSALVLAASRAGVDDALHAEFAASQPALLAHLTRGVPDMFPKAYRWVAEMEEIAAFVGAGPESRIFEGMAGLFERLARDQNGPKHEIGALSRFFPAEINGP